MGHEVRREGGSACCSPSLLTPIIPQHLMSTQQCKGKACLPLATAFPSLCSDTSSEADPPSLSNPSGRMSRPGFNLQFLLHHPQVLEFRSTQAYQRWFRRSLSTALCALRSECVIWGWQREGSAALPSQQILKATGGWGEGWGAQGLSLHSISLLCAGEE